MYAAMSLSSNRSASPRRQSGAYHVRAELLALAQGARETIEEADLELALTPPTDGSNIKVKAVHRAGLPWVPSHV